MGLTDSVSGMSKARLLITAASKEDPGRDGGDTPRALSNRG